MFFFDVFFSTGVDETYTSTMLYLGGAIATLTCSTKANYQNDVTIVGTKGRIRVSHVQTDVFKHCV